MEKSNHEIRNSDDLNALLLDTLVGLEADEVSPEKANAISMVADKINKNNLNQIVYNRVFNVKAKITFFEGSTRAIAEASK